MLLTCLLWASFAPAPIFWQEHTGACMLHCKYIFFHYNCINNWNCALNPCFLHKHVICTCDQTFLSSDWWRKAGTFSPELFWFLVFGSSVRAHTPWHIGVPTRHQSLHTTGPKKYVSGLHVSVRYVQIFLSASHRNWFIYFACSDM